MDRFDLGPQVEVELDVFSGRPNPRWTLSTDRVKELEERLQGLEQTEGREPPGLGYRGFLLRGRGDLQLRAFDSTIAVTSAGRTSFFKDAGGLEELLLEQARQHGYAELVKAFREHTG
jgi:hypothetical protein